jgi:Carboxypeptidase regulatory-like domain
MQRSVIIFIVTMAPLLSASGQQTGTGRVTLVGTVFVTNSSGEQSFVPGARVTLSGPISIGTESNENGEYSFVSIPFGTYTVEAVSPGLDVLQTVRVEGSEVRLSLELKPIELTNSVVVKSDQDENKDAAPSATISEQTLRDAPPVAGPVASA